MTRLLEDDYDSDMTDPRGRHPLPWSFYEEMEYRHKHVYNPAWALHERPVHVASSCTPTDPKKSLIVTLKFRGTGKPGTSGKRTIEKRRRRRTQTKISNAAASADGFGLIRVDGRIIGSSRIRKLKKKLATTSKTA
ncbi:hypothetical protein E4U43_004679 [Claviceps pusilla]|uniref:Uncharacterized protein n=1 Tax=Claviceps pusilla TaxID=123648 RepID=A0A9P7SZ76_9HYPO|nr:hypothetical protein E4U43_004679 [Claviceps pusilla]